MSVYLDCQNSKTTIDSLCNLFDCSCDELISFIFDVDLNTVYSNNDNSPLVSCETYLYQQAIKAFKNPKKLDYVCWFHLTRTYEGNDFHQGILPLGKSIKIIWELLFNIFKKSKHYSRLKKLKHKGVNDFQYGLKTKNSMYFGPNAMLVRDSAFKAKEIGNHDYLKIPEIIEDICNGYYKKYDIFLIDDVIKFLKPCIIKFKSNKILDEGCIESALFYIYSILKLEPLCIHSNTCFDSKGKIIPHKDILNIDYQIDY